MDPPTDYSQWVREQLTQPVFEAVIYEDEHKIPQETPIPQRSVEELEKAHRKLLSAMWILLFDFTRLSSGGRPGLDANKMTELRRTVVAIGETRKAWLNAFMSTPPKVRSSSTYRDAKKGSPDVHERCGLDRKDYRNRLARKLKENSIDPIRGSTGFNVSRHSAESTMDTVSMDGADAETQWEEWLQDGYARLHACVVNLTVSKHRASVDKSLRGLLLFIDVLYEVSRNFQAGQCFTCLGAHIQDFISKIQTPLESRENITHLVINPQFRDDVCNPHRRLQRKKQRNTTTEARKTADHLLTPCN